MRGGKMRGGKGGDVTMRRVKGVWLSDPESNGASFPPAGSTDAARAAADIVLTGEGLR
jgi:hypothetical protein